MPETDKNCVFNIGFKACLQAGDCKSLLLQADNSYDYRCHRQWLRRRGIAPRIARRSVDSSQRLGKWR